MPISKLDARELMSRGYEMGATVLNGRLQRGTDGTWTVDDKPLDDWLDELEGQEIVVVASAIGQGQGKQRICRVCGTEYTGYECPRCREIRKRLRGR
jgi:hypothetical protein